MPKTPDTNDSAVSRRGFLRDISAVVVTGTVLSSCARAASASAGSSAGRALATAARKPAIDGIGLQLYTVGDQLRTDFAGTIERVAQIGYRQVEFAGYGTNTPAQIRALLDRLKLKAPSTHIGLEVLRKDLDAQLDIAQTIGHEFVTLPSLGRSETPMNTVNAWKRIADECNTMGEKVRRRGMTLAFHSHSAEFVDVGGGKTGMDVFVSETDPAVFTFEMDLGWARVANQDPVAWFARYPGRFRMWHVKDFDSLSVAQAREAQSLRNLAAGTPTPRPAGPPPAPGAGIRSGGASAPQPGRPCPVGSGDIDFKPILAAWQSSGLEYFFVEQDGAAGWPGGSLKSVETSYQTMRTLLG
ncbi:MAG: sugar phosphate isomerase/epimerase [Gemmatimonadota bacterium]